jgi:uncharacterized membrane protein
LKNRSTMTSRSSAGRAATMPARANSITNIEVSLEYNPPAGKAGELVAELVKDPDKQVERAVENFRMVVERGGLGAA